MTRTEGAVDIKESMSGNVLILSVTGRLDAVTSPNTEIALFKYIDSGHHRLILDFSGVDYLSSAGMRVLLSIAKKLKSLLGKFVICCVTPNVMDVLKMSGFDHVLELSKTEADALERIQQ
jgi:anti-anti-sigma factor